MEAGMSGVPASLVEQRVFVYGEFSFEYQALRELLEKRHRPISAEEPPVAIEILREFSPQEFIGKVYVLRESAWRPVTPEAASSFGWYTSFQEAKPVVFNMKGSRRWEVEWFRFESSARSPNPYLAVALREIKTESTPR
jgi:hypothetical protein